MVGHEGNHRNPHILQLLESKAGKELLAEHGLRRALDPLQRYTERKGRAGINIYDMSIFGLAQPLGSLHMGKKPGHLAVEHMHRSHEERSIKLTEFATALAKANGLETGHNYPKHH